MARKVVVGVNTHLTFEPAALAMTINSPADGSILNSDSVIVSGSTVNGALSEVLVNGVQADIIENAFTALVQLSAGINHLKITASDSAGRETTEVRTVIRSTN